MIEFAVEKPYAITRQSVDRYRAEKTLLIGNLIAILSYRTFSSSPKDISLHCPFTKCL